MYQCNYKSVFRVHNVHEAVCFNLQKISEVDLFLFLLDTYDVLLDDITLVSDAGDVFTQLITKLEKFCFLNFEKLLSNERISSWFVRIYYHLTCSVSLQSYHGHIRPYADMDA
jgi:hypothetical protein